MNIRRLFFKDKKAAAEKAVAEMEKLDGWQDIPGEGAAIWTQPKKEEA